MLPFGVAIGGLPSPSRGTFHRVSGD